MPVSEPFAGSHIIEQLNRLTFIPLVDNYAPIRFRDGYKPRPRQLPARKTCGSFSRAIRHLPKVVHDCSNRRTSRRPSEHLHTN